MFEALLIIMMLTNITVDFLDRRSAKRADSYAMALWTNICQVMLILPLIGLIRLPTFAELCVCAGVGIFSAFGRLQWFKALSHQKESLSRLAPFRRLSSIIVLVFAFAVFKESFTVMKAGGGFMMILGAILIGFEKYKGSFSDLVKGNRVVGYVIIFACSAASIVIMYKYLLTHMVPILTIYFFLKIFQMGTLLLHAFHKERLLSSFSSINDLQVFIGSRILQTGAAFIYIFVIQGLNLYKVVPIVAMNPFMFLVAEWTLSKVQGAEGTIMPRPAVVKLRGAALVLISLGSFLLYTG